MQKDIYIGEDVNVPDEWYPTFTAVKCARGDFDCSGKAPDVIIEAQMGRLRLELEELYHDIAELAGLRKQVED